MNQKTNRSRIFIVSVFFISLILWFSGSLSAQGWLNGWSYRKSHVINAATGAGANYQVQMTVYYGSGTDAGGSVYCGSKCKTDFGDIRFTAADGATSLDYWTQSVSAGNNAVVWVEVAADLSSSAQTIFIYYGNSGATTASNGPNTFILFDDGTNVSSWNVNGTAGSTTGTGNPQPSYYANGLNGNYLFRNAGLTANTVTTFNTMTQTGNLGNFFFLCNLYGAGQMYRTESRTSYQSGFATTTSWTAWNAPSSTLTVTANSWYKFAIAITSTTSATLYYQQTIDASPALPASTLGTYAINNNGGYIGLVGDAAGGTLVTYWDNIITRKYLASGPSHGTWGAEECTGVTVSITAQTSVTCQGYSDGTITVQASGGAGTYQFSKDNGLNWTTGTNPYTFTGLNATTPYKIRAKDSNGCTSPAIP